MTIVKVSVIVPVYNTEEYLAKCLDSILSQSLSDIEVLCVDDGSTDNSLQIMHEYARQDKRILTFKHKVEIRGPGYARNLAIKRAKGKYVAFVDSDDFTHPDMLKKMYNTVEAEDSDLAMCKLYIHKDDPKEDFKREQYDLKIPPTLDNRFFSWRELKEGVFDLHFAPHNKIYKREFLCKYDIKFPEGYFYEDLVFSLKVFLLAKRMRFVREALYYYLKHREGATTNILSDRTLDAFVALNDMEHFIKNNPDFHELEERFLAFKFIRLLRYFYRNDSAHMDIYYKKLKRVASEPALKTNRFLNKSHKRSMYRIIENDLLGYLILDHWENKEKQDRFKERAKKMRLKYEKQKAKKQQLEKKLLSTKPKIFKKISRLIKHYLKIFKQMF